MANLVNGRSVRIDDSTLGEIKPEIAPQAVQVSITHPDPAVTVAVTGAGDADLQPPTGYETVLNAYEETANRGDVFTVNASGQIQVNVAGLIEIQGYADLTHSSNNATVGVAFSITRGGGTVYSDRAVHTRMPAAGDIGHLSGGGLLQAEAGDLISIGVASDITGTISLRTSSLVYKYLGE